MQAASKLQKLNGIFAVYKPPGITSAKFLDRVKERLLNACGVNVQKKNFNKLLKMGHGGTLDPMAEGVLVVGVGDGCKRLSTFLSGGKEYLFELTLGKHYDTYDVTGKLLEEAEYGHVTEEMVRDEVIPKFVGEIMQAPPAFSAIRIDGQRSYDLARANSKNPDGKAPAELPARPILIESLTLKNFDLPRMDFVASVGGGCYIRSLCVDMAAAMRSKGAMSKLVRTRQGQLTLADCLQLTDVDDIGRVQGVLH
jgi:tRNA pseudouridine55 synthase